ncbi:MAG: replicative DNA helicase [Deltaproteobacteria bacterium]|jgi:replicative DNA helicase|nr:replicative DNA helicase [Deltaproteobacteria bacterium]
MSPSPEIADVLPAVSELRLDQPNLDAERCILGSVFWDPDTALPLAVEAKLEPDHFYREAHAEIFRAMLTIYHNGARPDLLLIKDFLHKNGALAACGGQAYLLELNDNFGVATNVAHYAKLIIDRAIIRNLIKISSDLTIKCRSGPDSVEELLDEVESKVYSLRDSQLKNRLNPIGDDLKNAMNRIYELKAKRGSLSGLPTGFKKLDYLTGGFQATDLIILGGRPGMGKTSLALNFALNAAIPDLRETQKQLPPVPVAVFSMEMGREQILQRLICMVGEHSLLDLRKGNLSEEETSKLTKTATKLQNAPIYIDDSSALKPLDLRSKVRRLQTTLLSSYNVRLGLVVVDYLQLMQPNGRHTNREQEIREISGSLKAMAKELHVVVLTLSQLKRADEMAPSLADLRESGSIEQDADLVMFVLRKELLKPENTDYANKGELKLGKHRNGPTGVIHLTFRKQFSSFAPSDNVHHF